MRIYTSCTFDMETLEVIDEEAFEYEGEVALCGGGGGGGKGGGGDSGRAAREAYERQQAELARQKAEQEAKEKAEAEAEAQRRDQLRRQMLGQRDVLADEDEDAAVQKMTLG